MSRAKGNRRIRRHRWVSVKKYQHTEAIGILISVFWNKELPEDIWCRPLRAVAKELWKVKGDRIHDVLVQRRKADRVDLLVIIFADRGLAPVCGTINGYHQRLS